VGEDDDASDEELTESGMPRTACVKRRVQEPLSWADCGCTSTHTVLKDEPTHADVCTRGCCRAVCAVSLERRTVGMGLVGEVSWGARSLGVLTNCVQHGIALSPEFSVLCESHEDSTSILTEPHIRNHGQQSNFSCFFKHNQHNQQTVMFRLLKYVYYELQRTTLISTARRTRAIWQARARAQSPAAAPARGSISSCRSGGRRGGRPPTRGTSRWRCWRKAATSTCRSR